MPSSNACKYQLRHWVLPPPSNFGLYETVHFKPYAEPAGGFVLGKAEVDLELLVPLPCTIIEHTLEKIDEPMLRSCCVMSGENSGTSNDAHWVLWRPYIKANAFTRLVSHPVGAFDFSRVTTAVVRRTTAIKHPIHS